MPTMLKESGRKKLPRTTFHMASIISRAVNVFLEPIGFRVSRIAPPLRTTSDILRSVLKDKREAYVIDVGAASGNFSTEVVHLVPNAEVVCVEPIPECQKLLRKRFRDSKVTIVQAALGDHDGEVTFHETSGRDSSSVLAMERHRIEFPLTSKEVASYPVKLIKLDTLLADDEKKTLIDLIKIDSQGYEMPVLIGAERTLQRCEFVLVEMSLKPLYQGQRPFEDIILFMRHRGFRVVDYVEGIRSNRSSDLLQMDFLFRRSPDKDQMG